MKVLGLVGSQRKLGNTEILVREALAAAEQQGAQVEMLRLTDYNVLPCDGLAPCVFGNDRCNHGGDYNFIIDKIFECDGLVFGAPCYILESTAIVKQLIDHWISINFRSQARGKPAVVLVPYATRGWTPFAFLQPNIFLRSLGMKIIDHALILTQAMNEVVLYDKSLARVQGMGKELTEAIKTGDLSYRGESGICPLCHDRVLRILKDNETVECGVCSIRGKLTIKDGKINVHFPEEEILNDRFALDNIWRHFSYHIKPSRDYFTKMRSVTRVRKTKYRESLPSGKE